MKPMTNNILAHQLCCLVRESGELFIRGFGFDKTPAAHVFDIPHFAELFIRDTKESGLRWEPITNLEEWLESAVAAGVTQVEQHGTNSGCLGRNPQKWLIELRGGPTEHQNMRRRTTRE